MPHYHLLKNGFDELVQFAPELSDAGLGKGWDLPPEVRLFIIRLFVRHGASFSFSGTVKSLVQECDSDDRAVRKGMDYLNKIGLITQVKDSSGKISHQFINSVQDYKKTKSPAESPLPPLHEQIDAVLFPEYGDNPERVKRGGFSRASRYLLAVMLAHADTLGMVTGVSNAELRKLTGMTEQRLRGQIKSLLDSSILCGYMPGFNGSSVFGKVKSEFSLWLPHAVFGACSLRYGSVEYKDIRVPKPDLNEVSVIDSIYSLAKAKSSEWLKIDLNRVVFFGVHFYVKELHSFISEQCVNYLRWAVLVCASHLIYEKKPFLADRNSFPISDFLSDRCRNVKSYELDVCSFIAYRFMGGEAGFRFEESVFTGLRSDSHQLRFKMALFICRASLMLASRMNRALDILRESEPGFCFFMIGKNGSDHALRDFSVQFFNQDHMLLPSKKYSVKVYPSGGFLDNGKKDNGKIEIFKVDEGVSKLLASRLDDFRV
ncbi:hypothetical protein [Oceanisphaera psychrotolerans]|uniref:Uncharacterized protein n=1 Tax=Oceanisphaera psychrotolerans TaxID=1414654 RepID=A0A1J4QFR6_9GAMM|nr:hypothetical protein [Oceanisphaera psychrotolerans]OIN12344.1 hypothetical protein BFR47_01245 [Oceanisphaera psychrotolerans]